MITKDLGMADLDAEWTPDADFFWYGTPPGLLLTPRRPRLPTRDGARIHGAARSSPKSTP